MRIFSWSMGCGIRVTANRFEQVMQAARESRSPESGMWEDFLQRRKKYYESEAEADDEADSLKKIEKKRIRKRMFNKT
jgi:biopolymer transport protein ExbB/TolQ